MQKSWPNNDLSYDELAFCIIELILRDFEVQLIETDVKNCNERRRIQTYRCRSFANAASYEARV